MSVAASAEADPQRRAADPRASVFVSANAGSGKTKTLIDRVARLLLAGAEPETILCVTYTKAAAAEMQRRLFDLLGGWSVAKDADLRDALSRLEGIEGASYPAERLSEARALFARALETPGGLKIQTIHAFCEKLLRRFPLEAGVSPGFRVMDDADGALVADAARKAVARHALRDQGQVAEAYSRFSVRLDFAAFQAMFSAFEAQRGRLTRHFETHGGLEGASAQVWKQCGLDKPTSAADVEAEAVSTFDPALYRTAADILDSGGPRDQGRAAQLRAAVAAPSLETMCAPLFTGGGVASAQALGAAVLKARPAIRDALAAEQQRLEELRDKLRAVEVVSDTVDALTLAFAYLTAYQVEKDASGALDFADLIERAVRLTSTAPQTAWVLYKLDAGIAHILVDEAQDTAPEQWDIVSALAAEFFAGVGRWEGGLPRNLFVVGDEKQSIYSFQGAAPEILERQFLDHRERALAAGAAFERVELLASWRSTPEVLTYVDAAFGRPELVAALVPRGETDPQPIRHTAMRRNHAGCIDIWPLFREPQGDTRSAWEAPLDVVTEQSAYRRLADRIAQEIADLVARGDAVYDKETRAHRPAGFGDVLVLVRKRKALFEEVLRALKRRNIPVAGADRLALSEHILFDDLLAVARFVLFPPDDLTLAAVLKSPFCNLDDDSLYALAHGRSGDLWATLQARAEERADWADAAAFLRRALESGGRRRPFEFYAGLLTDRDAAGRTARARLMKRLGPEAEDALDEFLAQVVAAEQRGIADLECLADALVSLDITVKREMEGVRNEVRVMTAHGAKGLEAPIVFLPETTVGGAGSRGSLLATGDGGFLWSGSKAADCAASGKAREARAKKESDEGLRLLYVALTRARDRLVLAGRVAANVRDENAGGWWPVLQEAFARPEVAPHVRTVDLGDIEIRRFGPDPVRVSGAAPQPAERSQEAPPWTQADPIPDRYPRYASPSDLGSDAQSPAASPLAARGGLGRFRRGDLIHRLLQVLPDLPEDQREAAASRLLGRAPDLTDAQREEMAGAAMGVVRDPRFGEVFGANSRAEVAIAGTAADLPPGLSISGRIDRLVVLPDRVLVADFKTNRPSPDRVEDADPAYLRQMALYWAVLREVFPGRAVEAALVWTDGPKLMPIPEILLADTLAELGRNG